MKSKNIEAYIQWRKNLSHSMTLEVKQNKMYSPGYIWVMLYALCLFEEDYTPIHFDSRSVDFQYALENFGKKINLDRASVFDVVSGRVGLYIKKNIKKDYSEFVQELQKKQLAKPFYTEKVKLSLEKTEETELMSLTFPTRLVKNYFLDQFGKMQSLFFNQSGMPETIVYMKASIVEEKTTGDLIINFPMNKVLAIFRKLFWRTAETIGAIENTGTTKQFRIYRGQRDFHPWEMLMAFCGAKNRQYHAFFPEKLLPQVVNQLIFDYAQHHCEDPDEACEGPTVSRCNMM
jgi:hypothetical protein